MADLEKVVRPALPPSLRPTPGQAARRAEPDIQFVEIGGGEVQPLQLNGSYNFTANYSRKSRERGRTVDVVRVKNPDDDTQFLDIEVAREVMLHDQREGTPHKIQLAPVDIGPNMELLRSNVKKGGQ